MPTRPNPYVFSATSTELLNAIRNSATENYKNYIPVCTPGVESIKAIGAIIMQDPALQNEFLNALVNRIGRVILTSKMYSNPWEIFKKGYMDFGETVEEVFVNIAKPFTFDPQEAESKVFKREIPDVRAVFHVMNYQKFYKATISNDELRQAFLTYNGIEELIGKIVDSLYTAAHYDEFQVMKYMLAKHIIDGHLTPVSVGTVNAANMKTIISTVKGVSNQMEFLNPNYNMSGVQNNALKDSQYFIISADFDAKMDVEVLAAAFNMSKAEFLGHRILVDGFGSIDTARLAMLFNGDSTYTELTEAELTALASVPAVIVDRDFFMVFDNYENFTEIYNAQGLYWNEFYHVWKTFSVSPFAPAASFVPGEPAVSSVSVSPATASVRKGTNASFSATVTTTNFAPKSVNWTITGQDKDGTKIDNSGNLTIAADETATTITVKATSTYNSTKSGTATVTVTA